MAGMKSWSTTPANNVLANTGFTMDEGQSPSSLNDSCRQLMADVRTEWSQGANMASAATVDLSTATGGYVHITGTTTITSFGTCSAGIVRYLVFDGTLTLTAGANILLFNHPPDSSNIVTVANDRAIFVSEGSGVWRCLSYIPYTPVFLGNHALWIPANHITPSATGGCAALATIASAADRADIQTLDFDPTTQQYAQFSLNFGATWNQGYFLYNVYWSHPATSVNFGVVWDLQAVSFSNASALTPTAFGTAAQIADTGGTTNGLYISDGSTAVISSGNVASLNPIIFRLSRVATAGADTLAVNARLHGIMLSYRTDATIDA